MSETIIQRNSFILIGLTPVFIIVLLMKNQGHFTYTLDDPYIHLELAKNIWNGVYGINSNEFSAPSSSIIWPFILTLFASSKNLLEIAPLILNTISLVLCLVIFQKIISSSPHKIQTTIFLFILLVSTNQYGLIFNGMEHSLQCLVSVFIAWKVHAIILEKTDKFDSKIALALISLPLIRYESLSISLSVLLIFFIYGKRKESLITGAISITLISIFSAFIYFNQGTFLPSSVIVKTGAIKINPLENLALNIKSYYLYTFAFLAPAIILIKNNTARALILIPFLVHMTFGSIGWFSRYEPYILIYIGTLLILITKESIKIIMIISLIMPATLAHMIITSLLTISASNNIYNQQQQMAEISMKLNSPVAVNDLGLVAFRSENYVLDLYGLGSIKALKLRKSSKNTEWIEKLLREHKTNYIIIYDEWLRPPKSAIHVATLKLKQRRITPSEDNVEFYAIDKNSSLIMKKKIQLHKKSTDYEFIIHI